jgi:hypothetical protein
MHHGRDFIHERVQQTLLPFQAAELSHLLRLHAQDARQELLSITIQAQSFRGSGQLQIQSRGLTLQTVHIRHQQDVTVALSGSRIDEITLMATGEVFIESISAQLARRGGRPQGPHWQLQPFSQHRLFVNQMVRGFSSVRLEELFQQQIGLPLLNAQIRSVRVQGRVFGGPGRGHGHGRHLQARLGLELNGRQVGQAIMDQFGSVDIPVASIEEARTLRLQVQGDVQIDAVEVQLGQVRGGQHLPARATISVHQEILNHRPLELGQLLPFEQRPVRSLTINARSRLSSAEVALSNGFQILGSVIVSQIPMRSSIHLLRPTQLQGLRLQALSGVVVESIELEF